MKVHLTNSAVITEEGLYKSVRISPEIFADEVKRYYEARQLISYISYQTNIDILQELTNIRLPMSRATMNIKSGDIILAMKLKYRLPTVNLKGDKSFRQRLTLNDFEFFIVVYHK